MYEKMLTHRYALHRIPEIGHKEFKTTAYLLDVLIKMGGWQIDQPLATGLVAYRPGTVGSKTVAYRADIDALPMDEKTGVPHASDHEGFMHACGHDTHMAVALGLAQYVTENPCEENVMIIFQPAEEGPGGAMPMIEAGILEKFKPDVIYAFHISPEFKVGTVASKPGVLFVNNSELFIDLYGKSCHGALPHEGNDMIIAGMNLVNQLQTIVSRNINPSSCAVVTVGKFIAGTRLNIITDHARIEGTLRVMDPIDLVLIKERISDIVEGVARSFNAKFALDFGMSYSAVINDETILADFQEKIAQLEDVEYVTCEHTMASEDYGFFLERVPGIMFWLGGQSAGQEDIGLHHPQFYPDDASLEVGFRVMRQMLTFNK